MKVLAVVDGSRGMVYLLDGWGADFVWTVRGRGTFIEEWEMVGVEGEMVVECDIVKGVVEHQTVAEWWMEGVL